MAVTVTQPESLWDTPEKPLEERDFQLITTAQKASCSALPNRVEGDAAENTDFDWRKASTSHIRATLSPVPTVSSYFEFLTLKLCEAAKDMQYFTGTCVLGRA